MTGEELRRGGRPETRRIRREKRTVVTMMDMYCRRHHDGVARAAPVSDGVSEPTFASSAAPATRCAECEALLGYAMERIDKCPFWFRKPTCADCTVHCYRDDMRERVRDAMRYAGPRMLRRHPWLAVRHLVDGYRSPPALPGSRS